MWAFGWLCEVRYYYSLFYKAKRYCGIRLFLVNEDTCTTFLSGWIKGLGWVCFPLQQDIYLEADKYTETLNMFGNVLAWSMKTYNEYFGLYCLGKCCCMNRENRPWVVGLYCLGNISAAIKHCDCYPPVEWKLKTLLYIFFLYRKSCCI